MKTKWDGRTSIVPFTTYQLLGFRESAHCLRRHCRPVQGAQTSSVMDAQGAGVAETVGENEATGIGVGVLVAS